MNTINEKLNDGIFDAMLKVACEEVMDEQIAEWDKANTGDYEFSPEFERKMKKLLQSQTRKARSIKARKVLSHAAVVILAIMAVGFTVTISVEALRVTFFNTVSDFAKEYIGFTFTQQAEPPAYTGEIVYPTYIPDGFILDETDIVADIVSIIYRDDYGGRIYFDQYVMSEGLNVQIDGEHYAEHYILDINGLSVEVFESISDEYDTFVIWDDGITFFLISGTAQPSELIEMAKSVIR